MSKSLDGFPDELKASFLPLRLLGEGGMGSVYLARDVQLGREVAVKMIKGVVSPDAERRLMGEAQTLAQLKHPNVVQVFSAGLTSKGPYLVMEFLDGKDLGHVGRRANVFQAMLEVAEGLEYIHQAGVLHRDLKPPNIMLVEGRAVLADFGLADAHDAEADGKLAGTAGFFPPEVLAGGAPSKAADWYAWGVSLFILVEGKRPFPKTSKGPVSFPEGPEFRRLKPGDPLRAVLCSCLAADPERRPRSRKQVENLFRDARIHPARYASTWVGPKNPPSRGPAPWMIALSVLLSVAAGVFFWPSSPIPVLPPSQGKRPLPASPALLHSKLVRSWHQRSLDLDAGLLLGDLHLRVLPPLPTVASGRRGNYQAEMQRARRREQTRADLELLRSSVRDLPYLNEMALERQKLWATLADRSLAMQSRCQLLKSLLRFRELDAYYEAWGEPPPFRVEELLHVFYKAREQDPVTGLPPAKPIPVDHDPGPGRFLLFRWLREVDRLAPLLIPEGMNFRKNSIAWNSLMSLTQSHGEWRESDHLSMKKSFTLGPGGGARYRKVLLRVQKQYLQLPDRLTVEVNGVPLDVYPPPSQASPFVKDVDEFLSMGVEKMLEEGERQLLTWDTKLLEVEIQGEFLKPGVNQISLSVRSLPGLPPLRGVRCDRLVLLLSE
jgi:serine/threonine protein kinase